MRSLYRTDRHPWLAHTHNLAEGWRRRVDLRADVGTLASEPTELRDDGLQRK